MEVKIIGQMDNTIDHTFESANRVYDDKGLSPTINCCGGGGLQPKIIVKNPRVLGGLGEKKSNGGSQYFQQDRVYSSDGVAMAHPANIPGGSYKYMIDEKVKIKQATKQGYIECKIGGVADLSYPDSKTRRGRVQDNGDTSPTLTAGESDICKIESPYRIRKLTPLESWRLMGFNDEEFRAAEAVNSNTQLYKQAGNSIVVDVLVGIFKNIINAKEDEEMKKVEEVKTIKFETDKMINLEALAEKEPELFEELANDYPCEDATYIYEVKSAI